MEARFELRHFVRQRFGQSLCYYFLSFSPPYNFELAVEAIEELFKIELIHTFSLYEMFGAVDIVVRAWIPSTKTTLFTRLLYDHLKNSQCKPALMETFHVDRNPFHSLWPELNDADCQRIGSYAFLDSMSVNDLNDASHEKRLRDEGLLKNAVDGDHNTIRVFITIPPAAQAVDMSSLDLLENDLSSALKGRNGKETSLPLLRQARFYTGIGSRVAFLIEAVVPVVNYSNINDFNNKINELGLWRFGLKTTTYLTTRPFQSPDEQSPAEKVAPSAAFGSGLKTAEEYLLTSESDLFEHKGSFDADIGRYLATGQRAQNPALNKEILSTLVAFLNSRGGELVIGAIEENSFPNEPQRSRLDNDYPRRVGPMRVVGIQQDYPYAKGKDWDGYKRRILDMVGSHIGSSYGDFITLSKVSVPETEHDLCVIKVQPLPPHESPAYMDNKECYVRTDSITQPLHGPDLERFLKRRREKDDR